jgi:ribonucleotide monophosphatase NagD (HAD superfamily)
LTRFFWFIIFGEILMQSIKNFITDMDGVLVKGNQLIPGADQFIDR